MSVTLQFPSQNMMVEYLAHHPKTCHAKHPYLMEQKILDAVIENLADREIESCDLTYKVLTNLHEANESGNIAWQKKFTLVVSSNLVTALRDCAANKPV